MRRIAAGLPQLPVKKVTTTIVIGEELLSDGVLEVDGKPVKWDERYKRNTTSAVPVNHSRRMKSAYQKGGTAAVSAYLSEVGAYWNRMQEHQRQQDNADNK